MLLFVKEIIWEFFSAKDWWQFAYNRLLDETRKARERRTLAFKLTRARHLNAYCRAYRRHLETLVDSARREFEARNSTAADYDNYDEERERQRQQELARASVSRTNETDLALMKQIEMDAQYSYEVCILVWFSTQEIFSLYFPSFFVAWIVFFYFERDRELCAIALDLIVTILCLSRTCTCFETRYSAAWLSENSGESRSRPVTRRQQQASTATANLSRWAMQRWTRLEVWRRRRRITICWRTDSRPNIRNNRAPASTDGLPAGSIHPQIPMVSGQICDFFWQFLWFFHPKEFEIGEWQKFWLGKIEKMLYYCCSEIFARPKFFVTIWTTPSLPYFWFRSKNWINTRTFQRGMKVFISRPHGTGTTSWRRSLQRVGAIFDKSTVVIFQKSKTILEGSNRAGRNLDRSWDLRW